MYTYTWVVVAALVTVVCEWSGRYIHVSLSALLGFDAQKVHTQSTHYVHLYMYVYML